ncbi:hypothetical protein ACROYT_G009315 [Oculina patagonica]
MAVGDHLGDRSYSYYGASMFIILTLGLIGNFLTVIVLLHPQHRGKSMTPLMINLCVADLLVCLFGYTVAVNYNTADFANTGEAPTLCSWLAFINTVTGLASIGTLTAMAIVTYIGISRNEIAQQSRMTGKTEVLLLSGIWLYALALTLPPAMGWNRFIPIPSRISCHPDWYSQDISSMSYIIYLIAFGFFIPLLLIILSYSGIYRYIQNTSLQPGANDIALGRQVRSRQRTIRIVVCMTLAFFISWSPYAAVSLAGTIVGHESVSPSSALVSEMLAKASVIYNPILYVLLNSKFRVTLLQVFSWNRIGVTTTGNSDLEGEGTTTGAIEIQARNSVRHRDL